MILVVGLNPALDVTYEVDGLAPGATNRVTRVHEQLGGKPINVARTLQAMGMPVAVVGFAAGDLADRFAADAPELPAHWVAPGGPARRTVAVVDRATGEVTSFNEPGPPVDEPAWLALLEVVRAQLPVAAVVLSGSLPPGPPDDAYAVVLQAVRPACRFVALDTDGRGFGPGLAAGPDLVKPNLDELARLGLPRMPPAGDRGRDGDGDRAMVAAAALRDRGAGAALVSMGTGGLAAATADGGFLVRPPVIFGGNPTGAGDAVVAAVVAATVEGVDWEERLRRGAALGAAVVAEPVAGRFDPARYRELLAATRVERR